MSRMAYIGFDLDETLGSFSPLHIHVLFLTPEIVYQNLLPGKEPFAITGELRRKLQDGFSRFAACLASKDSELGILRKGILKIMRRLAEARANGHVKALSIYSNNGNLGLLLLASSMIENSIGTPGLFCNHVHWYNPIRKYEITPGRPGNADKTPGVLRGTFLHSKCNITNITNVPMKQLYFFDDRSHPIIEIHIPDNHYFRVRPYVNEVTDLAPLNECLDSALRTSGLAEDGNYLSYIKPILESLGTATNQYEDILATIKKLNINYKPKRQIFVDDTDVLIKKIDSFFPTTNYSENYFPVVDGGRKRKLKSRRLSIKKMRRKYSSYHKRTRKN